MSRGKHTGLVLSSEPGAAVVAALGWEVSGVRSGWAFYKYLFSSFNRHVLLSKVNPLGYNFIDALSP